MIQYSLLNYPLTASGLLPPGVGQAEDGFILYNCLLQYNAACYVPYLTIIFDPQVEHIFVSGTAIIWKHFFEFKDHSETLLAG